LQGKEKVAIVSFVKRHDKIRSEAVLAWKWLRKRPEYKADYKKLHMLKGNIPSELQEELKGRYGFCPLIDPDTKLICHQPPMDFFLNFGKLLGQYPFDSGVDYETVDYIEIEAYKNPKKHRKYGYKRQPLPDKLRISIDPKKPTGFLLQQIERYLIAIKETWKVKEKKPHIADSYKTYQYYVLSNLGLKRKAIRKQIANFSKDDNRNESKRKKAYRHSKKAEKIRTKSK
jgi:hypothetical protein